MHYSVMTSWAGSFKKLGLDNPGLEWNRISALEAFKENSVEFFLSTVWWLDAPYRVEKMIPKRLSNKEV